MTTISQKEQQNCKKIIEGFIYKLKEEIDNKFNRFQKDWYPTDKPEIAQLRFQLSALIFGNNGYLETLDALAEEVYEKMEVKNDKR
jgi:hypothetical protein